jgi:hypothetical protein
VSATDWEQRTQLAADRENCVELLLPTPFLAAHTALWQEPTAPSLPEELHERLMEANTLPARSNCVRTLWPVALLQPLADYADSRILEWPARADYGHGRGRHITAAHILAGYARRLAARETQ